MKKTLATLLFVLAAGIASFAQSNPTTFTNTNQPNPEPTGYSYSFNIATEDGQPVGTCPPNSPGCFIYFNSPFLAITLPDIPNQYFNHDTLSCTIKSTVVDLTDLLYQVEC